MSYADKYNTIGSSKDSKSFLFSDSYGQDSPSKYATLNNKSTYESLSSTYTSSDSTKYNTLGSSSKYQPDKSFMSSYTSELKFQPSRDIKPYDSNPSPSLLGVEDTPTPTSSIETEDSNTREVGERDVEGDGEQSD